MATIVMTIEDCEGGVTCKIDGTGYNADGTSGHAREVCGIFAAILKLEMFDEILELVADRSRDYE